MNYPVGHKLLAVCARWSWSGWYAEWRCQCGEIGITTAYRSEDFKARNDARDAHRTHRTSNKEATK